MKVQYAGEINFAVQRPDKLAIQFAATLAAKIYGTDKDKRRFSDPPHNMYASLAVPDSLNGMLDQVAATHNLRLPLANFAYSDPCLRVKKQICSVPISA